MSKTMGNFIGLEKIREIGETHGYDAFRYYLLRAAPFGTDLDWTDADFNKSYNELANVLGNLLNRTLNMVDKYRDGVDPRAGPLATDRSQSRQRDRRRSPRRSHDAYDDVELAAGGICRSNWPAANGYIDATAPFSLAKDPRSRSRSTPC